LVIINSRRNSWAAPKKMAAANTHGAFIEIPGATGASRNFGEGIDFLKAVFKPVPSATRWIRAFGALVRIDRARKTRKGRDPGCASSGAAHINHVGACVNAQ
jgi:hypothetical protein